MDRLINYNSGWNRPMGWNPTSNSEYGRGVLTSMRNARQNGPTTSTFDPSAPNYYYPPAQPMASAGGAPWQQSMGHVHSPTCPHFGTGANTKYPTGNQGGQYQLPGVSTGSNVVQTADHIEVLHGEAAQAYLAQQNSDGDGGQGQYQGQEQQPMTYYTSDGNAPAGMTVSFQNVNTDGGTDDRGNASEATPTMTSTKTGGVGGGTRTLRQAEAGDFVRVNGLPMDRSQRWRQGSASTHVVPSAQNLKPSNSTNTFKLCGKCPKCKNLNPASLRSSTPNLKQPNITGSQRFPVPRAYKSKTLTQKPSSQGIRQPQQGQGQSLPIQGENFTYNLNPTSQQ